MSFLQYVKIFVPDYEAAVAFFISALDFELAEDLPSVANDGRPKRWVVVKPKGGETGILLAEPYGSDQEQVMGRQVADRSGFFLRVDDFDSVYDRLVAAGVAFDCQPTLAEYGVYAVFVDLVGNRWDLLGETSLRLSAETQSE